MKIITCVRVRDEERNLARFCRDYAWADAILIADGGSIDSSKAIANTFPNTLVRDFEEKVYGDNGIWRNPECRHINFLLDWARELDADWIIFDDCDSFPTVDLQKVARKKFEEATEMGKSTILAHHIYLYGKDQWFPALTKEVGFMWSWKANNPIRARDEEEWGIIFEHLPIPEDCYSLDCPYSLLHDFCPSPEIIEKKLKFYRENGRMSPTPHPLEMGGRLASLESWMTDIPE